MENSECHSIEKNIHERMQNEDVSKYLDGK
jgi:hypothetical protein